MGVSEGVRIRNKPIWDSVEDLDGWAKMREHQFRWFRHVTREIG